MCESACPALSSKGAPQLQNCANSPVYSQKPAQWYDSCAQHTLDAQLMHVRAVLCLGDHLYCAPQVKSCVLGPNAKVADVAAEIAAASCAGTHARLRTHTKVGENKQERSAQVHAQLFEGVGCVPMTAKTTRAQVQAAHAWSLGQHLCAPFASSAFSKPLSSIDRFMIAQLFSSWVFMPEPLSLTQITPCDPLSSVISDTVMLRGHCLLPFVARSELSINSAKANARGWYPCAAKYS